MSRLILSKIADLSFFKGSPYTGYLVVNSPSSHKILDKILVKMADIVDPDLTAPLYQIF